ncbi:hypothetical protein STEG23_015922, partial [Scotinomys teguina]
MWTEDKSSSGILWAISTSLGLFPVVTILDWWFTAFLVVYRISGVEAEGLEISLTFWSSSHALSVEISAINHQFYDSLADLSCPFLKSYKLTGSFAPFPQTSKQDLVCSVYRNPVFRAGDFLLSQVCYFQVEFGECVAFLVLLNESPLENPSSEGQLSNANIHLSPTDCIVYKPLNWECDYPRVRISYRPVHTGIPGV